MLSADASLQSADCRSLLADCAPAENSVRPAQCRERTCSHRRTVCLPETVSCEPKCHTLPGRPSALARQGQQVLGRPTTMSVAGAIEQEPEEEAAGRMN